MADGSHVSGQSIGEFEALRHRTIITMLLVMADCLDRLRSHVRIDVVLGELLTDCINRLLSCGFIELNVVRSRSGWNCTNVEPLYTHRRRAGKLHDSERLDIVSAPVNEKGKPVWCAVHDRDERKPAGLVAERSQSVGAVFGIVILHISRNAVVVSTIKCVDKCTQCMTGRRIRSSYLRVCPKRNYKTSF